MTNAMIWALSVVLGLFLLWSIWSGVHEAKSCWDLGGHFRHQGNQNSCIDGAGHIFVVKNAVNCTTLTGCGNAT